MENKRKLYPDTFKEELNYQCGRILSFASFATLAWFLYIPLDIKLYPGEPLILWLRLGFPAVGLLILILRFFKSMHMHSHLLLTLFGAYMVFSKAILTALTKGDPAYIGGYLFLLTLIAVSPLQKRAAYSILYLSLTFFFSIAYFYGMDFRDLHSLYGFTGIFSVTLVVSCFIFILDNIRYDSWFKSRQLEKRNNEIEEELKIARILQQKLLPGNTPGLSGYKFYSTYIPVDEVGGDFYDFRDEGNFIEIFITDVSGHGLVSAFISMIVKTALDGIDERNSCPAVLYRLNDVLCKSSVNSNYMTSVFCIVDTETNIMKFSNAGHIPPLIYRKSCDSFFEINAVGKPLGLLENLHLEEGEIQLEKGDRVIFYTDGVTECSNSDKQLYGELMFKDFIRRNSAVNQDVFAKELIKELKAFNMKNEFDDDLCLLVFDVLHD